MPGPYSSMVRSVTSYMPYYAPPVAPQSNFIQGGSSAFSDVRPHEIWDQHSVPVNRAPRMLGMRWFYKRAYDKLRYFHMVATGRVESTKFQDTIGTTYGMTGFNDALYQAGYPRNLGFSEKVPTIPPLALGTSPYQMAARPQIIRSIFVNRRPFNSGIAPLPATPTNGMRS